MPDILTPPESIYKIPGHNQEQLLESPGVAEIVPVPAFAVDQIVPVAPAQTDLETVARQDAYDLYPPETRPTVEPPQNPEAYSHQAATTANAISGLLEAMQDNALRVAEHQGDQRDYELAA